MSKKKKLQANKNKWIAALLIGSITMVEITPQLGVIASEEPSNIEQIGLEKSTVGEATTRAFAKTTVNKVKSDSTVVTGKGNPNSYMEIRVKGKSIAAARVSADGTYKVTIPQQPAGTELLVSIGGGSNLSEATTIVQLRSTTINSMRSDSIAVTGTGEPNAYIEIRLNSAPKKGVASGRINAEGTYKLDIKERLPAGTELLASVGGGIAGLEEDTTIVQMMPTTINSLVTTSTTIKGTGEPNAYMEIRLNGSIGAIANGKINADGSYEWLLKESLSVGTLVLASVTVGELKSDVTTTVKEIDKPIMEETIYDIATEISGKGPVQGRVIAYDQDSNKINEAEVKETGEFDMSIPAQKAGSIISFISIDADGNESKPTNVTVQVSTVKINENISTGYMQDTQQLTTTTAPAGQKVTWSTSNDTIATVSGTGLVTYKKDGVVTITARTDNGREASITVTVVNPKPTVSVPIYDLTDSAAGTALANSKVNAYVEGKQIGTTTADDGGNFTMSFPKQRGGTVIDFVSELVGGKESEATKVSVQEATIKINEKDTSGFVKKKINLTTTTTPINAGVTWYSSDATIATVSSTGVVTLNAAGTATITAKLENGKSASVKITVIGIPKVDTAIYDMTTEASGTASGGAVVAYVDGEEIGRTVVGSDGKFTITFPTQRAGTTIDFMAEDEKGDLSDSAKVVVKESSIAINEKVTAGKVGDTQQLTATTTPAGQKVTWATSSAEIAKVDENGLVTFVSKGKVTITVTIENNHTAIASVVFDVEDNVSTLIAKDYTVGEIAVIGSYDKEATKVVLYVDGKAVKNSTLDPATMTYKAAAKSFITNASQKVEMVMSKGTKELKRIVVNVKEAPTNAHALTAQEYYLGSAFTTGTYDKEATKVVLYVDGKAVKNSTLDPATMTYKAAAKSFITNASQKVEMVMSKGTKELKRIVV
ncbi:hypothetical protein HB943_10060, partial [Listeria weihenstephanensis]